MRSNTLIVFDFETTGLDREVDEPWQVGAVALDGKTLNELGNFSETFCPSNLSLLTAEPNPAHGLSRDAIIGMGASCAASARFKAWASKFFRPIPVAYNIDFDMAFMFRWCPGVAWNVRSLDVHDLAMAHLFLPGLVQDTKLIKVAHFFGIKFQAHDAAEDAAATVQILRRFRAATQFHCFITKGEETIVS